MNLEDLIKTMHDDRMNVTGEQSKDIDLLIAWRQVVSIGLQTRIKWQIEELNQQLGVLQPEGGMADLRRRDREPLEREKRELERSLELENIQQWRDIQHILQEQRQLHREEKEEEQRYERMSGVLYAARPE